MNPAREINGAITHYPYALRPDAKRLHPEVSPLPGTWEQCTPEQLSALHCVDVQLIAPPVLADGESCSEGDPEYVGGVLRQIWTVTAAPGPQVPEEVDSLAFELTLLDLGLRNTVLAYVATLSAFDQIHWQRRKTMRRDSTLIEAGRVALNLTHGQVDELFISAKAREATV